MKNKIFISIFIVSILFSCDKDSDTTESTTTKQVASTENQKTTYSLLDYTPNVYHDYFEKTDERSGYSALKNPLEEYSIVERSNTSENSNIVLVNSQSLTQNKIVSNDNQNIYGKTLKIKIANKNVAGKGLNSYSEVSLYVPELIYITNPSVTNEKEIFPTCYSEDFVLEWNADVNNKEGLAVIAEYHGDNLITNNSDKITNVDYIPNDNGKIILNPNLFKDIPNLSIVHLILLRGNVKIEEIDGKKHKFYAESHMRLPIILVKDLSTVTSK